MQALANTSVTASADPSGYTNRVSDIGPTSSNYMSWDKEVVTAGTETPGAAAFTCSTSVGDGVNWTVALRPALGGDLPVFQNFYRQQD